MASLKVKNGTPIEVVFGKVEVTGQTVAIYEIDRSKMHEEKNLVYAYCMSPGESCRREKGDSYLVEV